LTLTGVAESSPLPSASPLCAWTSLLGGVALPISCQGCVANNCSCTAVQHSSASARPATNLTHSHNTCGLPHTSHTQLQEISRLTQSSTTKTRPFLYLVSSGRKCTPPASLILQSFLFDATQPTQLDAKAKPNLPSTTTTLQAATVYPSPPKPNQHKIGVQSPGVLSSL